MFRFTALCLTFLSISLVVMTTRGDCDSEMQCVKQSRDRLLLCYFAERKTNVSEKLLPKRLQKNAKLYSGYQTYVIKCNYLKRIIFVAIL